MSRQKWVVSILIVIVTLLALFPWLSRYIYGYPGDTFGLLHYGWWIRYALRNRVDLSFNFLVNYPNGHQYGFPFHPVILYPFFFFSVVFNEIISYNIVFLLFFLLNLVVSFLVIRDITGRKVSAVAASFFLSFSQSVLWQGTQHIEVFFIAPLVLFIWCLLRLERDPTFKNAFFLALSLAFTTLSFFQYGYFAIVLLAALAVLYGLITLLGRGGGSQARLSGLFRIRRSFRWLGLLALSIVVAGVITLPWTRDVLVVYFFPDREVNALLTDAMTRNSLMDLVSYGARPWDYLIPSVSHPLFGKMAASFYSFINTHHNYTFHSTFLPERANYIPYLVWVLAGVGVVWGWRGAERGLVVKSLVGLVFSFWLSLPAYMYIKGLKIYGPSYFLFKLFPMFRVYSRAGVMVLIFAVLLASLGVKYLFSYVRCRKGSRWAILLLGGILLWGLFENMNVPLLPLSEVGQRPALYEWLAKQPDPIVLVEYPRDTVDLGGGCAENFPRGALRDYAPSYETLFQRIHEKYIFNYRLLSDQDRLVASDLANQKTPAILSSKGITHVVWHTQDYFPRPNPTDPCQRYRYGPAPDRVAEGLEKVAEFDDGVVYLVGL